MSGLSRRELLKLGLAAPAALALADEAGRVDVHRWLIDRARHFEAQRRARFAAVSTKEELEALQASLRRTFLRLLDGLPEPAGPPPFTTTGRIEAEDYSIEKLAFESFPGYFVPALLYRPRDRTGPAPGVLSPCGHSDVGKAAPTYQALHINLARRGFVVLTFDPVGQGERSQFWDASRGRSRFNRSCGEHAVIGNPLYLLGTNLARYRIWDAMRGIDLLASLPEVDAARIGCVGNSGGGNLTAYVTALDHRVAAAAICCYITTLPRRMGNRIQEDPSSDPEQDIFGFVSEGIDHAGLLALCAPRPTLLGTARFDFFPIEGARESFAEAQRLYRIAGAADRVARAESPETHGLNVTLREAVYSWFERWLMNGRDAPATEAPAEPRADEELHVCADGQAGMTFRSRPFLPLAWEEFERQHQHQGGPRPAEDVLRDRLRIDVDGANPRIDPITSGDAARRTLVLLVNGNEAPDWRERRELLRALDRAGHAVAVIDPRGAGEARLDLEARGRGYTDPLSGVEENVAYNAFLVGESLIGLRVSDVLAAARSLAASQPPRRVVLVGAADAALVAGFAAAVEPTIGAVALEGMLQSYRPLFAAEGRPINAASILPGLLRDFGDIPDVLGRVAPRPLLNAAAIGDPGRPAASARVVAGPFSENPSTLLDWLRG